MKESLRTLGVRLLGDSRGFSIIEILVTSVIVSIAAVGGALMFSFGSTWVLAQGDDRVALALAQQRIEQFRALGFANAALNTGILTTEEFSPTGNPALTAADRIFRRYTCVQWVSNTDFASTAQPFADANVDPASCPASGAATSAKRITVFVRRARLGSATRQLYADPGVIVQGWITTAGL